MNSLRDFFFVLSKKNCTFARNLNYLIYIICIDQTRAGSFDSPIPVRKLLWLDGCSEYARWAV